jgi:hypothetical protein
MLPGIGLLPSGSREPGFKAGFGRFRAWSGAAAPSRPELPMNIAYLDPKRLAPCRFPATIDARGFRTRAFRKARARSSGEAAGKIWEEST